MVSVETNKNQWKLFLEFVEDVDSLAFSVNRKIFTKDVIVIIFRKDCTS